MPSIAVASFLMASAVFVFAPSAPAGSEEIVAGGRGEILDKVQEPGMPASNLRVEPILESHPHQMLVICVAGCRGPKPHVVQALPMPQTTRTGEMRTTSADGWTDDYDGSDAITCVGGCRGRPGQVLQRVPLPPEPREPVHHNQQKPASPHQHNEPLDRLP